MKALIFAILLLSVGTVYGQTDIRRVDFKNFTYPAYCAGEEADTVTVKKGEYSYEKQDDGFVDRFYFKITEIKYGDVNGDRRDEAIILSVCNTGGTGYFSEGFIYTMKAGKAALLARIPGGDRGYGGLRSARVEDGSLIVESNDAGENGASCCPEWIVTTKYKVSGGRLHKVGKETREPVDAPERIRFDAGKSGATFKTNVGGSDSKKFVVRARAGQKISISIDVDDATIMMITEAPFIEGNGTLSVVMPTSRDFIFAIQNGSATEQEITVTVKIN